MSASAKPQRTAAVWRRLDARLDLNYIFLLRYERIVGKDHVVTAIPGTTIQLPPLASGRGYAGKKVEVCHQPNGDFHVYLDCRLLHIQPASADAGPVRAHEFRQTVRCLARKNPPSVYTLGRAACHPTPDFATLADGLNGGQGSAGMQPERRFSGRDWAGAFLRSRSPTPILARMR
jgi:hypothetical protein